MYLIMEALWGGGGNKGIMSMVGGDHQKRDDTGVYTEYEGKKALPV
jgi:hypothetical protein